MTARPWFKFFPSDWRSDARLRTCSPGARGLWIDMLCFMHEADPRGFLLLNGRPVDDGLLASLCSMDPRQCRRLVAELEAANIFSRQNGCIFSRKMVRDTERELRAKEHGKSGGNPNIVKDLDGPTLKGSLNPSLKGRVNGGLNPNGIWPLQEKTYQDRALDAGGCSDLDGEAPFGRGAA